MHERSLNSELQLALATEINENLNVEVTDVSKLGTIVIDSIYKDDNNSTNINMKLSPQTEEIIVEVESEEGESIAKDSYRVEIIDISDDVYKLKFIDLTTGEEYIIDSTQVEAAAVPALIYVIGAKAISATIQYIGKKAFMKIGTKTFYAKSKDAAKKATVNFSNLTINVGTKNVYFTRAKMRHILEGHHPTYWTGATGKSMFDPNLSVTDIKNIITSVIRYNKTKINTNLKAGLSENYYQTINGVKYRVHINSEGYVSSAYPNK